MADTDDFSFATFVAGPSTADALAAARAAAAASGGLLAVTGASGLGKTHLLRAIVQEARDNRRWASYVPVGRLLERMLAGYAGARARAIDYWVERHELVAFDDLDGAARRPRLAREIAAGLARLQAANCQVVVAGSCGAALRDLLRRDARVVALGAPDAETRIRIVAARAARAGVVLAPDVARLVAERCSVDGHTIDAALVGLGAYAFIHGVPVGLAEAETVLAPLGRPRPERRPRMPGRTRGAPALLLAGIADLIEFAREVGGGRIGIPDVRGRDVYVGLVAGDGEAYTLRLRVGRYLETPLRCAFVTSSYRTAMSAWPFPDERGPFRSPDFICMPPVAEFYGYHPEHTYRHGEGSFTATVAAVFAALHAPEYTGRFSAGRRREEGW